MTAQEQNFVVEAIVEAVQGRIAEIRAELHQSVEEALARVASSFLQPQDAAPEAAGPENGQPTEEFVGHSY